MTAYGRANIVTAIGRFTIEIQSLNRRFLEIHTHVPKSFMFFDMDIRKWVAQRIARGQVNIVINVFFDEKYSPQGVIPNVGFAKAIKEAFNSISSVLELKDPETLLQMLLSKEASLLQFDTELKNKEDILSMLQEGVNKALDGLIQMRQNEGDALSRDISKRLSLLETYCQKVQQLASKEPTAVVEKLNQRLEEFVPGVVENEERILREIVIFAERSDITEEIVRLFSHFDQFKGLLTQNNEHVGKTLDFLVKEMHRELQTISSKTADKEISTLMIDSKGEVEKIKEQIQNIE